MIRTKVFFGIILLMFFNNSYSQFNIQFQQPKPPEVSSFERYGNVAISEYSGRPNVVVPLHTIEHGDLKIPLQLIYNSNGIRVDEEASRVGLGWYFGTGMISQIIQGKDDLMYKHDFKFPDFFDPPYPQFVLDPYPVDENIYTGGYDQNHPERLIQPLGDNPGNDKYSIVKVQSESSGSTLFPYFYNGSGAYSDFYNIYVNHDGMDTERDFFQANFFGHEILFYISSESNYPDGTVGSRLISVVDGQKYKVEIIELSDSTPASKKYKWTIKSPDGITYEFEEMLVSKHFNSPYPLNGGVFNISDSGYDTFISETTYDYTDKKSRIWKITKIIDTKGNSIIFDYEDLSQIISRNAYTGKVSFVSNNYSESVINPVAHNTHLFGPTNITVSMPWDPQPYTEYFSNNTTTQTRVYRSSSSKLSTKSILKNIMYGNTTIEFNSSSRVDIPLEKKLDNINIKYKNNSIGLINFNQSYFNPNHSNDEQKRLKLDSVNVIGRGYSFEYKTDTLPDKNSLAYDYWGFYNGMTANSSIANDPFRMFENSNGIISNLKNLIPVIDGNANRSSHPDFCQVGLLEEITYPTGGRTEFSYELNSFNNYFFPNYDNKLNFNTSTQNYDVDYQQSESKGNGLRIHETIDYTREGKIAQKKQYNYESGKHIAPIIGYNTDPLLTYRINVDPFVYTNGPIYKEVNAGNKITSFFHNSFQSSSLGNGDGVGYDKVTVETIDSLGHTNGKLTSYFTNIPDKSARDVFGQGGTLPMEYYDSFGESIRATDEDNGSLIQREVYNTKGEIVRDEQYIYESITPENQDYNVRVKELGTWSRPFVAGSGAGGISLSIITHRHSLFYYYPIKQTKTLLKNKIITDYFDNGNQRVAKNTSRLYDSDYFLIEEKETDIEGSHQYSKRNYDYIKSNAYNIYNLPYRTKVFNKTSLVSDQINYYSDPNTENYPLLTASKLNQFGNTSPQWEQKILYHKYDEKGNIHAYKKENDITVVIIWGYDQRLPIAKIENAYHPEVQDYLANLYSLSDNDDDRTIEYNGNEGALRLALDQLRIDLPNAQVTTYTYDPMIGVTSITGPEGLTTYFEYDNLNRLINIKDNEGNLVSKNDYNYRSQN